MTKKSERILLSITPETKERWQEVADKQGRTMPNFIRHSVEVYIAAYNKNK